MPDPFRFTEEDVERAQRALTECGLHFPWKTGAIAQRVLASVEQSVDERVSELERENERMSQQLGAMIGND